MRAGFGALAVNGAVPAAGTYYSYWLRNTFASSLYYLLLYYGWRYYSPYSDMRCRRRPRNTPSPSPRATPNSMVQCLNDVNYVVRRSAVQSCPSLVLDESYCPHVLVLDGYLPYLSQSQRATT